MSAITSEDVLRIIREYPHVPTVAEIAVALKSDTATVSACLETLRTQGRVRPMPVAVPSEGAA